MKTLLNFRVWYSIDNNIMKRASIIVAARSSFGARLRAMELLSERNIVFDIVGVVWLSKNQPSGK